MLLETIESVLQGVSLSTATAATTGATTGASGAATGTTRLLTEKTGGQAGTRKWGSRSLPFSCQNPGGRAARHILGS